MPVAKEQLRQIISENNLNSVTDVYALLRDSFRDILQELMEAEPAATLGYEKNHKGGGFAHGQQTQRAFPQKPQEPVWGIPD